MFLGVKFFDSREGYEKEEEDVDTLGIYIVFPFISIEFIGFL